MRTARTLFAGAALTAALAFAAPAAHATGAVNAYDPSGHGQSSSSAAADSSSSGDDWSGGDSSSDPSEDGGSSHGHHPHGGLHTGGGGMALSGGGMAAGSIQLLRGLRAGTVVLRRRRTASGVAA
jgi:hypothetical protein